MVNNAVKNTSSYFHLLALLRQNAYFFTLFFLFLLIGGIGLCRFEQGDLLLYFNANRSYFGDLFFKYGTKLGEEWAFIGILICFLFIRFRYALLIPLAALIVTLVAYFSKNYFLHPRPSEYYKSLGTFQELSLIHI